VGGDLKSVDFLARILVTPFLFWLVLIDFIRMIVGEEPVSRTRRIAQGTPMRMRKLGHPKIAFHSAESSALPWILARFSRFGVHPE